MGLGSEPKEVQWCEQLLLVSREVWVQKVAWAPHENCILGELVWNSWSETQEAHLRQVQAKQKQKLDNEVKPNPLVLIYEY